MIRTGEEFIFAFDVVKFVCENYKKVFAEDVAETFDMPVKTVIEIYEALGIKPLIVVKQKTVSTIDYEKIKKHLGDTLPNGVKQQLEKTKNAEKSIIKASPTAPNRIPIKRPKGEYSNTTPFGIAKQLREDKNSFTG